MTSISNCFGTICINTYNDIRYIGTAHYFKTFNINQNLNTSLSNIIFNNTNYNNTLSIINTGNVGIGSTIPKYQLDVAGTARITNIIGGGLGINNINASNLIVGTLSSSFLPTSGVTPGSYGSVSSTLSLSVDNYGRITTVTSNPILIPYTSVSGLSLSATIDTSNASNITSGILSSARLPSIINATFLGDGSGLNNLNASNILSGTLNQSLLPTVISPTNCGSFTNAISLIIDNYGRITSIQNTTVTLGAGNASNLIVGTLSSSLLPTSGVSSGSYGSASSTLSLSVDNYGRITTVTSNPILIPYTSVSGLSLSATIDTTNASNITSGILSSARLPSIINATFLGDGSGLNNLNASNILSGTLNQSLLPTVISPTNCGSFTNAISLIIDNYGRITSIQNTTVTLGAGNASNLIVGTLSSSLLPTSGVSSGSYGSASSTLSLSVDNYGRITTVTSNPILIPYTSVSGLSLSATIDTTNASNITSGILSSARLPLNYLTLVGDGSSISNINASNIRIGSLNINRYPTVSITPGQYGQSSALSVNVSSLTVDTYGRILSISNTSVQVTEITNATNATNITTGTLSVSRLATGQISSIGTYGSAFNTLNIIVDTYGRVTSVSNNILSIASTRISGLVSSATIDGTSATNITSGFSLGNVTTLNSINAKYIGSGTSITNINVKNLTSVSLSNFPTSGVISSLTNITNITYSTLSVDIYGRITSVIQTVLDIGATITTGKLNVARIPTITNVVGIYGSTVNSLSLTVDLYGTITSITNSNISISYTTIVGLPSTSTLNITNITNIGTSINSSLSIGNSSQPITISASNVNLNIINSIYNKYNNILYNFPIYFNKIFTITPNIIIPIKYKNNTNIYNSCEIKIYFTVDQSSSGSAPYVINFNSSMVNNISYIDTTNVVSVANNEEQFISTGSSGASPILSYTNTVSFPQTAGYASKIIKNLAKTSNQNFINVTLNGLDNPTGIYNIETLYYDTTNNLTRCYANGMFQSNNGLYLYFEIIENSPQGNVTFSGYYSVINYY